MGVVFKKTLIGPGKIKKTSTTLQAVLLIDLKCMNEPQTEHWFGHGLRLENFIGWCTRIKNVAVKLAVKIERAAIELSLIEANLNRGPNCMLRINCDGSTEAELEFVGLKFSIAYLVVKIVQGKPPLFPFGVGG